MIIGSFPQYLHMIDILGTHERPRDCRQSKKSASVFNNDRERFCSRAQLTKPCLPLITQSLIHEAGLTFICPFINSLLQTQTSPELLSVYCLPSSPLLWLSGALPTNLQTQETGCRKSLLVANCWPSYPQEWRFKAQLEHVNCEPVEARPHRGPLCSEWSEASADSLGILSSILSSWLHWSPWISNSRSGLIIKAGLSMLRRLG